MRNPTSTLEKIERFLAHTRLAMVGMSRNEKDFSADLFRELCRRGYDMVPVNPHATDILSRPCFARVQEIKPKVEAVLLMTPPEVTESVAADCVLAGVRSVWMYRGMGNGAVNPKAVEICEHAGIEVVAGECPFMFLPETAGVHRWHGWWRKLVGSYPARETESRPR